MSLRFLMSYSRVLGLVVYSHRLAPNSLPRASKCHAMIAGIICRFLEYVTASRQQGFYRAHRGLSPGCTLNCHGLSVSEASPIQGVATCDDAVGLYRRHHDATRAMRLQVKEPCQPFHVCWSSALPTRIRIACSCPMGLGWPASSFHERAPTCKSPRIPRPETHAAVAR